MAVAADVVVGLVALLHLCAFGAATVSPRIFWVQAAPGIVGIALLLAS